MRDRMKDKKFWLSVLIISLLISAGLGVASAQDRSYTIPYINMDLYPQEDEHSMLKKPSITLSQELIMEYTGIYL